MKRSKSYRAKKWTFAEVKRIGAHLEDPNFLNAEVMFAVVKDFEWLGHTKWYSVHGRIFKIWKGIN